MIIFLHDNLGYKILKFINEKDSSSIEKLVLVNDDQSKLNKYARKYFKKKIIYWAKSKDNKIIQEIRNSNSQIILLVWWPYILKKKFLNIKKYYLNTHPSYLPFFKGKDPNFWSLLKGGPYGVTLHHVNNKIDSGQIAFQSSIKNIDWTWDAKKLYDQSILELFSLFKKNFSNIKDHKIPAIKQARKYKKINFRKDMLKISKINLNSKIVVKNFLNLLRAKNFLPNDGIVFFDNKNKYSINIKINKIK